MEETSQLWQVFNAVSLTRPPFAVSATEHAVKSIFRVSRPYGLSLAELLSKGLEAFSSISLVSSGTEENHHRHLCRKEQRPP